VQRAAEANLLRKYVEGNVGQRMTLPTAKIGNMLVIWTNYDLFDMDPIWNTLDMIESSYYVHVCQGRVTVVRQVRVVRLAPDGAASRADNLDWLIEGRLTTVDTFARQPMTIDPRGVLDYCVGVSPPPLGHGQCARRATSST